MYDKIKVTNSDYPFAIPNGEVMRVVQHAHEGIYSDSDNIDGTWFMLHGTYEPIDNLIDGKPDPASVRMVIAP